MKVDFSKFEISYCDNCKMKDSVNGHRVCCSCIASNDYYSVPSCFATNDDLISKYVTLLSDYSKMLNNMGFEIVK